MWIKSAVIWLMTSREGTSFASTGFNVLGSARNATTRRPPLVPGSLAAVRTSSAVLFGLETRANPIRDSNANKTRSKTLIQRRVRIPANSHLGHLFLEGGR